MWGRRNDRREAAPLSTLTAFGPLPTLKGDEPPMDPMRRVTALGTLIARRRDGELSSEEFRVAKAELFGQAAS